MADLGNSDYAALRTFLLKVVNRSEESITEEEVKAAAVVVHKLLDK